MKKKIQKKYKLKSKEVLEKEGKIYFHSPSDKSFILTDGDGTFKHFDCNCFKKTFTVAESDKIIEPETFKALKSLFEEIE